MSDQMKMHTTSEVIGFAKKLEIESAKFYENMSQQYSNSKDCWLSFAKENRKNIIQIESAYYGGISDAIEGCFAFDIATDSYVLETNNLANNMSYSELLNKAIEIEEIILKFYYDAAEQSQVMMGDVSRTFKMVSKKRETRRLKLKSLLDNAGHVGDN